MDGVLRIGNKLIKNSNNIIYKLNKNNIKTMIVTNECRYTVETLKEDLTNLGLNLPKECYFYTAALSSKYYLEKKIIKFPNKKFIIGVIGELGLYKTINELSIYSNFILKENLQEYLEKNLENKDDYKIYLIVGAVNRIKINHLDKILNWVKNGAKIITTCIDTTDPSSKGDFNLGMPNHILYLVGYSIKTKSYSTGKPNPLFKKIIMNKLQIKDEEKILFVGDTIYSDIKLAEESNFKSCLVLSGNTNKDTLKQYVIEPDYVIDDVSYLPELLNIE